MQYEWKKCYVIGGTHNNFPCRIPQLVQTVVLVHKVCFFTLLLPVITHCLFFFNCFICNNIYHVILGRYTVLYVCNFNVCCTFVYICCCCKLFIVCYCKITISYEPDKEVNTGLMKQSSYKNVSKSHHTLSLRHTDIQQANTLESGIKTTSSLQNIRKHRWQFGLCIFFEYQILWGTYV